MTEIHEEWHETEFIELPLVKSILESQTPHCIKCGKQWKRVDITDTKFYSEWEPDCDCYSTTIRMSFG